MLTNTFRGHPHSNVSTCQFGVSRPLRLFQLIVTRWRKSSDNPQVLGVCGRTFEYISFYARYGFGNKGMLPAEKIRVVGDNVVLKDDFTRWIWAIILRVISRCAIRFVFSWPVADYPVHLLYLHYNEHNSVCVCLEIACHTSMPNLHLAF